MYADGKFNRADRAPEPCAEEGHPKGGHVVLLDGTLIRARRRTGKDDWRNYSGKHMVHGAGGMGLLNEKEQEC
ncbi:hypothetical protein [Streptomyces cupreus]|uniref:Uncharacterized protein n=1 Tax=Streptomyces cupreus TaxID=2759956 RepID=A0A7X1ME35_9ACTN|nr:hypothetical protein [Streptomyces cupreus]MBC2907553.1 hypothetical protein [Streptomyces cupreus]